MALSFESRVKNSDTVSHSETTVAQAQAFSPWSDWSSDSVYSLELDALPDFSSSLYESRRESWLIFLFLQEDFGGLRRSLLALHT